MSAPSAFGTFRVLHQIGSGVLGPVFRSYDSQRDRLVAIKAFKLDLVPEAAARFADACRELVAAPAHPAIVAAVDVGVEGATPYLALEYASGDALDVFLRQSGAVPVDRALLMLRPLAQAIDASWDQGVGHGSLHPRDVFTTGTDSELRVTGFGIAQALERVGAKPPLRRPYAAPERLEGGEWDRRADVYGLAVIAHEMLTGRRAAAAVEADETSVAEAAKVQATEEPWRAVFAKGMAEQPADRFQTAAALLEALAEIGKNVAVAEIGKNVAVAEIGKNVAVAEIGKNVAVAEIGKDALAPTAPTSSEAGAGVAAEGEAARKRVRTKRPRAAAVVAPRLPGIDDVEALVAELVDEHEHTAAVAASVEVPIALEPDLELRPEPELEDDSETERPPVQVPVSQPEPESVTLEETSAPHALGFSYVDGATSGDRFEHASPVAADVRQSPWVPAAVDEPRFDEPAPSPFPWAATAAVAFAGLVLGVVIGYQVGFGRGREAVIAEVVNSAPAATPAPAESGATPSTSPTGAPPVVSELPAVADPPPAALAGRLVIQSEPSGALAYLDDRRVGTTPVTVPAVPLGRHDVRVTRSGYAPATERVTLSASAASKTVRLHLRRGNSGSAPPGSAFGSIEVDSRPRGAQVSVDGRRVGQTPVRVPELSPGDHKVLIELTGHRPVSSTVKVVAGEQTRLAVTLEQVGFGQAVDVRKLR